MPLLRQLESLSRIEVDDRDRDRIVLGQSRQQALGLVAQVAALLGQQDYLQLVYAGAPFSPARMSALRFGTGTYIVYLGAPP